MNFANRWRFSALPVALALAMTPGASFAQNQSREDPYKPGHLQPPKPYGDRGSTTLGVPPPTRRPAPQPGDPAKYWKDRIIAGPRHGGTVVIINGSPCYTPWYYGWGYPGYGPGYYNDAVFYANLQLGGFNLGYQQRQQYLQQQQYSQALARERELLEEIRRRDAERSGNAAPRPQQKPEAEPYYLHKKPKSDSPLAKDPALAAAVADLEAAFRTGDISRLEKHVNPTDVLTLQTKGQSRSPLAGAAYLEMTREALRNMKTVRYELDKVEPASNGAWMVYGTHVLKGEDGKEHAFSVGFVLKKRGDAWMIAEVSADPAP